MTDKLTDLSCASFAEALSSASSVPGGGGTAAIKESVYKIIT